jgi:NitT/TauT family transport system substrate-binding protein
MMTRRSMLYGGLAAGSLLTTTTLTSCGQANTALPLRVGVIDWPGYELFYLAQSLGFYGNASSKTPIELVNFNDMTELVRAYRQQQVHSACFALSEVLQLTATQADQRLIMVIDESAGADAIVAKPSIQKLADLKGKRVASDLSALSGYILVNALEKAGLTLQDVSIVNLGLSDQLEAYKADRCDAVITFDPYRTGLLNAGAKVLFNSTQMPGEIVDVILTSQPILNQYAPTLQVLTQGFFRAIDYLQQNPTDAIGRMADREKMRPDEFAATLKLLKLTDRASNRQMLDPENSPLIKVAAKLNALMIERKLLQQSIDFKSVLTTAILPSR